MANLDTIVTITITVQDASVSQAGFGTPLVMTHESPFDRDVSPHADDLCDVFTRHLDGVLGLFLLPIRLELLNLRNLLQFTVAQLRRSLVLLSGDSVVFLLANLFQGLRGFAKRLRRHGRPYTHARGRLAVKAKIVSLPGDGIGPEVVAEAVAVLQAVAEQRGHEITFEEHLVGGCAIDQTGTALPDETLDACRKADAVLLGAVGGPKWDDPTAAVRPEQGLLGLRKILCQFANLRPVDDQDHHYR